MSDKFSIIIGNYGRVLPKWTNLKNFSSVYITNKTKPREGLANWQFTPHEEKHSWKVRRKPWTSPLDDFPRQPQELGVRPVGQRAVHGYLRYGPTQELIHLTERASLLLFSSDSLVDKSCSERKRVTGMIVT